VVSGVLRRVDRDTTIAFVTDRLNHAAREIDGGKDTSAAELVTTLGQPEYRDFAEDALSFDAKNTAFVQTSSIENLDRLLHHGNEFVRAGATWVAVATGSARRMPDCDNLLLGLVQSGSSAIRIVALNGVAATGAVWRSPQILGCVFDRSLESHRVECAIALDVIVRRPSPTAVTRDYLARLARMLSGTQHHVEGALYVLERLGSVAGTTEIIDGLVRIMRRDTFKLHRQKALAVIREMGRAAARGDVAQCLVELSGRPDPAIRRAVARAIPAIRTKLPPPGTANVVMRLLRDDNPHVRYNIAAAVRDLSELEGRSDFLDEMAILFQNEWPRAYKVAAKVASKLSPAAVTPDILGHLMRGWQHRRLASYARSALAALMQRGLRIFVEGSGPDGKVYRAQTVDELSRVESVNAGRSEELASAGQPAAVNETIERNDREAGMATTPGESGHKAEEGLAAKVARLRSKGARPVWIEAYVSYSLAVALGELPRKHTQDAAYDLITKQEVYEVLGARPANERYGLKFGRIPKKNNWKDYNRKARQQLGELKNKPRAGRDYPVGADDVERDFDRGGSKSKKKLPTAKLDDIHRHERLTRIRDQLGDVFAAKSSDADKAWQSIVDGLNELGVMNADVEALCERHDWQQLLEFLSKRFPAG
jgi:HEAT repeat protein